MLVNGLVLYQSKQSECGDLESPLMCLVSRGQEWFMMESLGEGLVDFCPLISTLLNWFLTLPFKFLLYIASLNERKTEITDFFPV